MLFNMYWLCCNCDLQIPFTDSVMEPSVKHAFFQAEANFYFTGDVRDVPSLRFWQERFVKNQSGSKEPDVVVSRLKIITIWFTVLFWHVLGIATAAG